MVFRPRQRLRSRCTKHQCDTWFDSMGFPSAHSQPRTPQHGALDDAPKRIEYTRFRPSVLRKVLNSWRQHRDRSFVRVPQSVLATLGFDNPSESHLWCLLTSYCSVRQLHPRCLAIGRSRQDTTRRNPDHAATPRGKARAIPSIASFQNTSAHNFGPEASIFCSGHKGRKNFLQNSSDISISYRQMSRRPSYVRADF